MNIDFKFRPGDRVWVVGDVLCVEKIKENNMELEIQIIREALEIIERNATKADVIKEQCNLILKYARLIKLDGEKL